MNSDESVRVRVVVPRSVVGYWLTPEGEAALDAAEQADQRAVAAEAAELARQRRNRQVEGAPLSLV